MEMEEMKYCAYAYKKDDPYDILGFVYDYKVPGGAYLKDRVKLVEPKYTNQFYYKTNFLVEHRFKNQKTQNNAHKFETKRFLKKFFGDPQSICYNVYGESPNQHAWRWLKQKITYFPPPEGYVAVVVRYNSKHCRIKIDESLREESKKILKRGGKPKCTVEEFRNLPFEIKK
jgi:hypothetical protein